MLHLINSGVRCGVTERQDVKRHYDLYTDIFAVNLLLSKIHVTVSLAAVLCQITFNLFNIYT